MNMVSGKEIANRVLSLAREGALKNEVPVAAILALPEKLADKGSHLYKPLDENTFYTQRYQILAAERNRIIENKDPSAHAEMLAIRQACFEKQSERIVGSVLVVSLEPCLMCSGLISLARVDTVLFMTEIESSIGLQTLPEIIERSRKNKESPRVNSDPNSANRGLNHVPHRLILQDYKSEARSILQNFFAEKRKKDSNNP